MPGYSAPEESKATAERWMAGVGWGAGVAVAEVEGDGDGEATGVAAGVSSVVGTGEGDTVSKVRFMYLCMQEGSVRQENRLLLWKGGHILLYH